MSPKIRSTLEAAALCKIADRGQITGGPLAFDNAVSLEAARTKGIISLVAGQSDILVVPDLEAGNMLVKQLEYLADAQTSGIAGRTRANCSHQPCRQSPGTLGLLCARFVAGAQQREDATKLSSSSRGKVESA